MVVCFALLGPLVHHFRSDAPEYGCPWRSKNITKVEQWLPFPTCGFLVKSWFSKFLGFVFTVLFWFKYIWNMICQMKAIYGNVISLWSIQHLVYTKIYYTAKGNTTNTICHFIVIHIFFYTRILLYWYIFDWSIFESWCHMYFTSSKEPLSKSTEQSVLLDVIEIVDSLFSCTAGEVHIWYGKDSARPSRYNIQRCMSADTICDSVSIAIPYYNNTWE